MRLNDAFNADQMRFQALYLTRKPNDAIEKHAQL